MMTELLRPGNVAAFYIIEGTHTPSLKKLRYDQKTKSDNPWKSILPVKPWNSMGNGQCRTPTLSGGAQLFIMCLCLQSRKDVFCSLIGLSLPCR